MGNGKNDLSLKLQGCIVGLFHSNTIIMMKAVHDDGGILTNADQLHHRYYTSIQAA